MARIPCQRRIPEVGFRASNSTRTSGSSTGKVGAARFCAVRSLREMEVAPSPSAPAQVTLGLWHGCHESIVSKRPPARCSPRAEGFDPRLDDGLMALLGLNFCLTYHVLLTLPPLSLFSLRVKTLGCCAAQRRSLLTMGLTTGLEKDGRRSACHPRYVCMTLAPPRVPQCATSAAALPAWSFCNEVDVDEPM